MSRIASLIAFLCCGLAAQAQSPPVVLVVDAFTPERVQYHFAVPKIETGTSRNGFLGYEMRFSAGGPLDAETWNGATILVPFSEPGLGAGETVACQSVSPFPLFERGDTYHLAIRYTSWNCTDAARWSDVSNAAASWDATPPSRVNDLAVTSVSRRSLRLEWTAPADDGLFEGGDVTGYEVRYSTVAPEDGSAVAMQAWWTAPTTLRVPTPPVPIAPGSTQRFELEQLKNGVRYTVAVQAADERPNWSPISFPASGFTLQSEEVYTGTGGASTRCGAAGGWSFAASLLLLPLLMRR